MFFLIRMLSNLVLTAAAGFLALRDARRGDHVSPSPSDSAPHPGYTGASSVCSGHGGGGGAAGILLPDNGQVSIRVPGSESHNPSVCPLKDRHLGHSQSSIKGVMSQKVRFSCSIVGEVPGLWKYPGAVVLGSV